MNLKSMTQVNYNDPLFSLGKKIESSDKIVVTEKWIALPDKPGLERSNLTGQLRTNFALPPKASKVGAVKINTIKAIFDLSWTPVTLESILIPVTPKPVSNNELTSEFPTTPGIYRAMTCLYEEYSKESPEILVLFEKFWTGKKWLYTNGSEIDSSWKVVWMPSISAKPVPGELAYLIEGKIEIAPWFIKPTVEPIPVSKKTEWLAASKHSPKDPGVYYASNLSEELEEHGFDFFRFWNGSERFEITGFGTMYEYKAKFPLFWNNKKIDPENIKRFKEVGLEVGIK